VDTIDSSRRTPLSHCAGLGNLSVCGLLLDQGAVVDCADFGGRAPLSYSTERGDISISACFLDKGAMADAPDFEGRTPLGLHIVGVRQVKYIAQSSSTRRRGDRLDRVNISTM